MYCGSKLFGNLHLSGGDGCIQKERDLCLEVIGP